MAVQPEPILRGAARWLERLPRDGVTRTRSLLATNPRLADLTPTQYETALTWLQRNGLLADVDSSAPVAVRVFEAAVCEAGWFVDADTLVRTPDELPDDALEAADALGLDNVEAFQHLQNIWGKVDTETREMVGAAGEARLVALLKASIDGAITQVSQWSDGLGYDIQVSAAGVVQHLEVKSSTRQGRFTFYLSRNEFEVLRRDRDWTLVALTLADDLSIVRISSIASDWILASAPQDRGPAGRWEACKFEPPTAVSRPGIPALVGVLKENASPLLRLADTP